ncbi:MAG: amidohydrolase [Firmicutes bacterium]|nr:amidohydrolase [Bacillota bacterium]
MYTITNGIIHGSVLINDDGKIAAVGEVSLPEGVLVIDGQEKVLMPGIIDAHSHVGIMEEGRGWEGNDVNEAVDPITPHIRALDGINPEDEGIKEALAGGITAACVLPGSANVIGGEGVIVRMHGRCVEEMVIKESIGLKVAFGENPKRVYSGQKKSPSTRMATAALLRENLVKADNYRNKLRKGQVDPEKAPERDLRLESLVKVLNKEIPLRAHAHRMDDIMTAIRIAEEFDLDIVIEHCTDGHKIADILAKKNIKAIVGPTLSTRSKVELKDRSFDTLVTLWKAGVLFSITMDHPVIHLENLPVAAALAVKAGLPEEEALKALTINPAKILGIDDAYGSIEVGKVADLVLWNKNPLEISSIVEKVFINGELVYNNK